jgi:HD-GYP domain-containing protein (c-di-GMP phosphodiesterase class II)
VTDKVHIHGTAEHEGEKLDQAARDYSEKLQTFGKTLVSSLYMLVRSVKLYNPDNAVFARPLAALEEAVNAIIFKEGKLELVVVKDSFFLNGMLLRVDVNSLDNVHFLLTEFQQHDVGSLDISRPVTGEELRNFVWIFAKEQQAPAGEDGVAGKKLLQIRLTRWSKLKERLSNNGLEVPDKRHVDRKRYTMTVYARAIVFLRKYLEGANSGKPLPLNQATRIVQDLVDLCHQQTAQFMGVAVDQDELAYLLHHQANTCMLCIVFGEQLGLTKTQLRELGLLALFHELGMAKIAPLLKDKRAQLTEEERAMVVRAPYENIRMILSEADVYKSTLLRVAATYQHRQDYGTAQRDEEGNVRGVIPGPTLLLYSRVLTLCSMYDSLTSRRPYRQAYSPNVAMALMRTELAHRFDPILLRAFIQTLGNQPIRRMAHPTSVGVTNV